MYCPLCLNRRIEDICTFPAKDLVLLYSSILGIDINRLIGNIQNVDYFSCLSCDLRFFNPVISTDQKFYEDLQKTAWYYQDDKQEYRIARKYINQHDKVLEIGCGRGTFSKFINLDSYTGLETSTNAYEMARKERVHIVNETIENFSQKNQNAYDVVCSFQVLEHVADPHSFLLSQIKCLKPNGVLLICVPSENSFLKYEVNNALNIPPHHLTRWNDNSLEHLARVFNLSMISIEHERILSIDSVIYLNVLFQKLIMREKLIDFSFKRKIINKISKSLAMHIYKRIPSVFSPNGHSVVAAYRKIQS